MRKIEVYEASDGTIHRSLATCENYELGNELIETFDDFPSVAITDFVYENRDLVRRYINAAERMVHEIDKEKNT